VKTTRQAKVARQSRREDLLLAASLARSQAAKALATIELEALTVEQRLVQARNWLRSPLVAAGISSLAGLWAVRRVLRRVLPHRRGRAASGRIGPASWSGVVVLGRLAWRAWRWWRWWQRGSPQPAARDRR
jgi:hypothetical protein